MIQELEDFLGYGEGGGLLLVFDLETNGFSGCSVLSCAGILVEADGIKSEVKELRRFERFYYPVEPYNPSALMVNGLTEEVIRAARGAASYEEHFFEDPGFVEFAADAVGVIGHNVSFDLQFVPEFAGKKSFCTMRTNRDLVAAGYMPKYGAQKYPKLSETAGYYGIPFEHDLLHGAMYDAEITLRIFERMLKGG